jgi:CHRD domain-containing protein
MRFIAISRTVATLAAIAACDPADRAVPTEQSGSATALAANAAANPKTSDAKNYVAHLSGDNEVPPRPTQGQGELKLQLSDDGQSLDYRITSSNITNVVQSHIHLAPAGVNGPIVVFLYGLVPPGGGRTDGVLAKGTITAANLIGLLKGHPLSDLIDAIEADGAYANVHTNDGVGGTNTGPGDFPGGEIRGQVRANGPTP